MVLRIKCLILKRYIYSNTIIVMDLQNFMTMGNDTQSSFHLFPLFNVFLSDHLICSNLFLLCRLSCFFIIIIFLIDTIVIRVILNFSLRIVKLPGVIILNIFLIIVKLPGSFLFLWFFGSSMVNG